MNERKAKTQSLGILEQYGVSRPFGIGHVPGSWGKPARMSDGLHCVNDMGTPYVIPNNHLKKGFIDYDENFQVDDIPQIKDEAVNESVDNVNHPPHYTKHPSGVEAITVCEHMTFNLGNVMKYIWRADHKYDAVEDLKKAAWYLNREIERLTKGKNCNGDW